VFLSDPDAMMEFADNTESNGNSKDVLTVQTVLREFPPIEDFTVQWDGHALFHLSNHDPKKIRKPGGRPSSFTQDDILKVLAGCELSYTDWYQKANELLSISESSFKRLKKEAINCGRVFYSKI
jgi:hypothetical protein